MTSFDAAPLAPPVASLGSLVAPGRFGAGPRGNGSGNGSGSGREVLVRVARSLQGAMVYLESQAPAGPRERVRALALPVTPASPSSPGAPQELIYRAVVPSVSPGMEAIYVPLVVRGAEEMRGAPLRIDAAALPLPVAPVAPVAEVAEAPQASLAPPPAMELIAHVRASLPRLTSFGATPEGLQLAFYIQDGEWSGPRVRARYRTEGGDWLLVRRDGVGIPNARATLETEDGALLYYQLTGTVELGPNGYERALANDFDRVAPLSIVGKIATSSPRWSWLNRLTLVGAGTVDLKNAVVQYDVYSLTCDPSLLAPSPSPRPRPRPKPGDVEK
jgi:hypothetical protein